jgi:hypothetical protein
MLCTICNEREATHQSLHLPRTAPAEQPRFCQSCREVAQRQDAANSERRIRQMVVDWDTLRPILAGAEWRANADELRRLTDLLQFAVERYGRVLPPDFAAFVERHRRERFGDPRAPNA